MAGHGGGPAPRPHRAVSWTEPVYKKELPSGLCPPHRWGVAGLNAHLLDNESSTGRVAGRGHNQNFSLLAASKPPFFSANVSRKWYLFQHKKRALAPASCDPERITPAQAAWAQTVPGWEVATARARPCVPPRSCPWKSGATLEPARPSAACLAFEFAHAAHSRELGGLTPRQGHGSTSSSSHGPGGVWETLMLPSHMGMEATFPGFLLSATPAPVGRHVCTRMHACVR